MVKIPTPATQGAAPLGNVTPISASETRASGFAEAAGRTAGFFSQAFGDAATISQNIQKMEDDRQLLELQKNYNDLEREVLFDPNAGLFTKRGKNAIGATEAFDERFRQFEEDALQRSDKLSRSGRQAANQYLQSARSRLLDTHVQYEMKERDAYNEALQKANMDDAVDHAARYYNNEAEINRSKSLLLQNLDAIAARNGWSAEQLEEEQEKAISGMHEGVLANMQNDSPTTALAYLERNREEIDPVRYAALRAGLERESKTEIGTNLGRGAYMAENNKWANAPVDTQVEFLFGDVGDYGPLVMVESDGNPDAVSPKGAWGLTQAMPETQKDPGYGVAPMRITDDMTDEEIKREQLRFGKDYYRALYTHPKSPTRGNVVLSLIAYNYGPGNVQDWLESGGNIADLPAEAREYPQKIYARAGLGDPYGPNSAASISAIEDPDVRAAAQASYTQMATLNAKDQKAREEAILVDLYAEIDKATDPNNPNPDPTPVDTYLKNNPNARTLLGSNLPHIRSYEKARMAGDDIPENPALLQELYGMTATPEGREQFMSLDLTAAYKGKLPNSDLEQLILRQAAMKDDLLNAQTELARKTAENAAGVGQDSWKISQLNTVLNNVFDSAGLEPKADSRKGREDAKRRLRVETEVLRWTQERAADGSTPNELEVINYAQRLLTTVVPVFDPHGFNNAISDATIADILISADDIGLEGVINLEELVLPNGASVGPEERVEAAKLFAMHYGREPSGAELMRILINANGV